MSDTSYKIEKKDNDAGVAPESDAPASRYAVVLAAGEGHRFGSSIPKQFVDLCGKPMLWWSLKEFHEADPDTRLVLVLHPGYFAEWDIFEQNLPEEERIDVLICVGGRSRSESVYNALSRIASECAPDDALIAIHDAARPLINVDMINRGWKCCEESGSAVPAVKITDSLRHLTPDGSTAVNRSDYVAVQTPQIFRYSQLREAYSQDWDSGFTDDASLVEKLGVNPALYEGDPFNIKVTNPLDIDVAEVLMRHIR